MKKYLLPLLLCLAMLATIAGCGSNPKLAGNFSMTLKDYQQAAQYYEAALKDDPDSVTLLTGLGRAYYNLGEYDKAEAAFKGAVEVQENYPNAIFYLGLTAIAKGDREAGFKIFETFRYVGKLYVTDAVRDKAKRLSANPDATNEQITQAMFQAWDDGMKKEQDSVRSG